MSQESEDHGRLSPEQISEYVELFLPHYGWQWPPKEVPPLKPWWEEPMEVLPTQSHLPNTVCIEITGTPQAGKSKLMEILIERLSIAETKNEIELFLLPEPFHSTSDAVFEYFFLPPSIIGDDDPPLFSVHEKDDGWISSILMQIQKDNIWDYWMHKIALENQFSRKLLLGYRGPTDSTIWINTLLTHTKDEKFKAPEDIKQELMPRITEMLVNAQMTSRLTAATVFVGADRKEAKKRRKLDRKKYPGWITDSLIFDDYAAWCGYYIDEVYPKLQEINGKGILVLNGNSSLEDNAERIIKFIQQNINRLTQGEEITL